MRKPMFKTFVISIASVVFAGMLMSPASADTPTPYDSVAIEHRQVQITPSNNESPQVIGQSYPRRDFIAEEDAFGIQTSFLQSIGGFKDMGTDNCHTWNTQPCLKWGKSIGSTGLWGNIILPVCPCDTEQLECPDFACMRKMRASAKIDKFALAIKTKDGIFL